MWSDSLRAQEFPYSEYAIESLRDVLWARRLLTTLASRGGVKAENSETLFEVRFALELHRAGVNADNEYATGIGESRVDFHLKGDQEWLIEIVSLRESKPVKDATRESDGCYEVLILPPNPCDRNSLPGEMIRAQRKIGEKVYDNKKAQVTKFPTPARNGPMHVIIADMRGYVRPKSAMVRGVKVPSGQTLSGPKPRATASPRGGVGSSRRRTTSP